MPKKQMRKMSRGEQSQSYRIVWNQSVQFNSWRNNFSGSSDGLNLPVMMWISKTNISRLFFFFFFYWRRKSNKITEKEQTSNLCNLSMCSATMQFTPWWMIMLKQLKLFSFQVQFWPALLNLGEDLKNHFRLMLLVVAGRKVKMLHLE